MKLFGLPAPSILRRAAQTGLLGCASGWARELGKSASSLKNPTPWVPSPTLSAAGRVVSDPLSLLKAEGVRFISGW
eukprot:1020786-Pyramimonas_sp.AAC.1